MKIAIEAQRIFRSDKHGMDFVILETLKELQKRKDGEPLLCAGFCGRRPLSGRIGEPKHHRSALSLLSIMGASGITLYCTAIAGRPATLYIQYSSVVVPGPLGTDIA